MDQMQNVKPKCTCLVPSMPILAVLEWSHCGVQLPAVEDSTSTLVALLAVSNAPAAVATMQMHEGSPRDEHNGQRLPIGNGQTDQQVLRLANRSKQVAWKGPL